MVEMQEAMKQALEVLEDCRQNINPERGYADDLEKDIGAAIEVLRSALVQKKELPPWWPAVEAILNEHGLQAIDFVADFKAAMKQVEPVAYVKFRNGEVDYDCDDNCIISNTPGDIITDEIEWRAVFTEAAAGAKLLAENEGASCA